jgi:hypothetical protein
VQWRLGQCLGHCPAVVEAIATGQANGEVESRNCDGGSALNSVHKCRLGYVNMAEKYSF